MAKRYIAVIITAVLLLSFTACSGQVKTGSGTSSTVSSESSSMPESSSSLSQSSVSQSDSSSEAVSGSSTAQTSSKAAQSSAGSSPKASSQGASSSESQQASTVRVVIPEGFTLSQIGDRLEAKGVCKKADLLKAANSYDFSYYSLIGALGNSPKRCFKLEGYLFPDTYDFYTNMKPQDALGKMLRGAQNKIGSKYSYSGMTTDQVVILASMIEKEANSAAEMKKISSVFHNRLKAGMKLQADPTIIYIESYVKPNLTGDINRYNSYYNTYKCPALPAGAICNPGAAALNAAANPDNTDYLYFAADKSGNYYYAATYEEHKANLAKGNIIEGGGMQ